MSYAQSDPMTYLQQSLSWVIFFLFFGLLVGIATRIWRRKPNGSKR